MGKYKHQRNTLLVKYRTMNVQNMELKKKLYRIERTEEKKAFLKLKKKWSSSKGLRRS